MMYSSPVFGPVHSRRLGLSLGINLLPSDGKVCTFDCLYCECGLNAQRRSCLPLPTQEEVLKALEARLQEMQRAGAVPDVLTFAGNGEPTIHPRFLSIVEAVIGLRDCYCPQAKVGVLSNATRIHLPEVRDALMKVDSNIQKLDTVDGSYIRVLDRPSARYSLARVIESLKLFRGHVIIQTMFLKGSYEGVNLDNTADRYVLPWIEALIDIAPQSVMIYTLDRPTPVSTLQKADPADLQRILSLLHEVGIHATAAC